MSLLPGAPPPEPADADEAAFFAHCDARDLRIQRCAACGRFRHPPGPACPDCRSMEAEWAAVPGSGTLFSYTVAHHAVHPGLKDAVPYTIALVHLDGAGDVRLVSNLIGAAEPRIGLRVALAWEEVAPGRFLPRFRAAA
jgi:uncharacterized protein